MDGQVTNPAVIEEPPVVVVVPPPSKDQLLALAISTLPALGKARRQLDWVLSMDMLYVQGQMPKDQAAADLDLSFETTDAGVASAGKTVMDSLAEEWLRLAKEYDGRLESGDPTLEGLDFEAFAKRFLREKKEQEGLMVVARELMTAIQRVAVKMGIDVPVAGKPETQPEPEESKSLILRALDAWGRRAGGRISTPIGYYEVAMSAPVQEVPPPSWTTPPVIDVTARDYRRFITVVVPTVDSLDDTDAIWGKLGLRNITLENLTAMMADLAEKARSQTRQSTEILRAVTVDNERDAERISEIQRLRELTQGLLDYFGIEIQPGQGEAKS